MNLSNQTRTILMIAIVLLLAYFLFNKFKPVENEGNVENLAVEEVDIEEEPEEEEEESEENESIEETLEETLEEANGRNYRTDYLSNKLNSGINQSANGKYKKSSYIEGDRGQMNGPAEWEKNFDAGIIDAGLGGDMDNFAPNDDTNGLHANFNHDKSSKNMANQNHDVNDLFDSKNHMPGEVNNNWYEVMPEPVSVKNHALVTITKPMGVNTIGTSNRNMSYDFRGDEVCPKFNVGPFLNSSIEPSPYANKLQMV